MKKTLIIVTILSLLFSALGCVSSKNIRNSAHYLAAVKDEDSELWGYINKTGEYVIEPQFLKADDFTEAH